MAGLAPSSPTFRPSEQQSSKTTSAADSLLRVPRYSFFSNPFGSSGGRGCAADALNNRSFDDQVEDLMDNPW